MTCGEGVMGRSARRQRAARAGRLAAAVAVAASGLVVLAPPASAAPVSVTLNYSCTFPLFGTQTLPVTLAADIPASVAVGGSTGPIPLSATIRFPDVAAQGFTLVGAATIEGVGAVQLTTGGPAPITLPRTSIPPAGAFDVAATGSLPDMTFPAPGEARIVVGDLPLTLTPRTASGAETGLGVIDSACTLVPGQNSLLASIRVGTPIVVTAAADRYSTRAGTVLTVPAPGVLGNDSATGGAALTATSPNTAGTAGSVNLAADGSFTYTPAAGFTGTDTFTYVATGGGSSSTPTTVTVTVTAPPVNLAPTAVADAYTTPAGTALTVPAPGVLRNDTDPENDALTATSLDTTATAGRVSLAADGSFVYTPAASFSGTDTFTYVATGGGSSSAPATVTITVTAPPPPVNLAPTAVADAYSTPAGTALTVPAPGVLRNDTDPENDAVTATSLDVTGTAGRVALSADGSFVYTPAAGFSGSDSFAYAASDGPVSSAPARVTITVAAPPPPPVPNRADLSVAVSVPATASPGTTFPVTLTVRNAGPAAATTVGSGLVLPSGLRVTGAGGGAVTSNGRAVGFVARTVAAGAEVRYTVQVTADRSSGSRRIAAATASSVRDPNLGNNAVTGTVAVR